MNFKLEFFRPLLLGASLLALAACDGGTADVNAAAGNNNVPGTPAVTAVGEPAGAPASATIGAAGGTLTSTDGRLRLDIPAGALGANQVISILPITNTAPGGIGHGFQLTPDGQTFAQAITLTYTPAADEWNNSGSAVPGLAFQKADGTWQVISGVTAGTTPGTFSATTTHFTNYSYWNSLSIRGKTAADNKTAGFTGGKTFNLEVVQMSPPVQNSGGFMQLTGSSSTFTSNNCCTWLVNGQPSASGGSSGDIAPLGAAAAYTTPAHMPPTGKNPVAISASFAAPGGGQIILVRNIHILAHQYKIALTLQESTACQQGDAAFATTYSFTSTGNVLLTLDNDFNITGSGFNVLNTPPSVTGLNTCDPANWSAQWLSAQTHDSSITAASGSYNESQGKLHFILTGEWSDTPPLRLTGPSPPSPPPTFDTNENRSSLADLSNLTPLFYFDGFDGEVVDQAFSAAGNRNSTDYGFAVTITQE